MDMKVTIRKIAELAGVSRGTVDKVLHERPGVSDEVRTRVKAVMQEQGYQPVIHHKAQQEPVRRYHLAVIIPRLTNPFSGLQIRDGTCGGFLSELRPECGILLL